jgi:hypothetical protein
MTYPLILYELRYVHSPIVPGLTEGATACREAPVLDNHSQPNDDSESFLGSHLGLTITSTLQGCLVYWKGLKPSELLEYISRLVSFMQELPF